jgi:hypothetical protein
MTGVSEDRDEHKAADLEPDVNQRTLLGLKHQVSGGIEGVKKGVIELLEAFQSKTLAMFLKMPVSSGDNGEHEGQRVS